MFGGEVGVLGGGGGGGERPPLHRTLAIEASRSFSGCCQSFYDETPWL